MRLHIHTTYIVTQIQNKLDHIFSFQFLKWVRDFSTVGELILPAQRFRSQNLLTLVQSVQLVYFHCICHRKQIR